VPPGSASPTDKLFSDAAMRLAVTGPQSVVSASGIQLQAGDQGFPRIQRAELPV
jgi:hypothetical protein